MNKKIIGIIFAVVVLILCCIGGFMLLGNNKKDQGINNNIPSSSLTTDDKTQDNEEMIDNEDKNGTTINDPKKVLVVYFSATNNTKNVAEKIAKNLNADTFEIVPKDEYTSEDLNYSNLNSRVSKEHDDETLRNIELKTTKVDNWELYDTIIIGYPIWWGVAAWPVDTFVASNNFTGKRVYSFCTSASSGLGQSKELLEALSTGGNWLEGHRFSSRPSDSDIKAFTDSIN